jgi:hypothetical protein
MKKIILATVLLSSFSSLQASNNSRQANFNSGFLLGAHFGVASHKAKFNQRFFNGTANNRVVTDKANRSFSNAFAGLSLGYRHVLQNNFTAALMFQFDNFDTSTMTILSAEGRGNPFKNEYSRSYTLMPELVFGYIFHKNWHVGIGFGAPFSKFKTAQSNVNNGNKPFRANRTINGFQATLHMDVAMNKNWFLKFAAGYERYAKLKNSIDQEFTPGVAGTQYATSLEMQGFKGHLGIVYKM